MKMMMVIYNNTYTQTHRQIYVYYIRQNTLTCLFCYMYIGGAQVEGKKKKKKSKRSMYQTINRRNPPCAIIINNVSFKPKPELKLKERSWSQSDVDKILTLGEEFGIHFNLHLDLEAQQMKAVLSSAVGPHSTYSALLLFIMTHGSADDMLYGSDGELVSLKELAEIFEAANCPALKDKPKILILHYCRGKGEDLAHREGHSEASGARDKHSMLMYVAMYISVC